MTVWSPAGDWIAYHNADGIRAVNPTLAGFSLHPDGTRVFTSAPVWPFDIWLMDNFDPPRRPLAWLLGN